MTSRKKRDTMLPYAQTNGSAGGGASGSASFSGATANQVYLWCATARDNTISTSGTNGTVFNEAERTSSACYMRGLKESIEIQTSTGIPWQWRRICFTVKGPLFTNPVQLETTNGWQRLLYNVNSGQTDDTTAYNFLRGLLFKGQFGIDWSSTMVAPTDNSRVSIKYDKTRIISSGNSSGVLRKFSMWHPMNKTLYYDDDETGGGKAQAKFSVTGKQGMGDYYVCDFFYAGLGATSSDAMNFNPNSTLYWHEK